MGHQTRQIILTIILVGTEGQLDEPETDYGVRHLEDSLKAAVEEAVIQVGGNKNFGWTYIVGHKG